VRLGNAVIGGAVRFCICLDDETLLDVAVADACAPSTMAAVLADPATALAALAAIAKRAPTEGRRSLAGVDLSAPIARPGKIIGIGLNYRDHAEETGQAVPDFPTVFAKFPTSISGAGQPIQLPARSAMVDYEGELGVVVGQRIRSVREDDALASVLGYVAFNDVSARDVQNRTSQWTLGKSFDTFAPTGPFLVTADQIDDPQALDIATRLNGVEVQRSNTKHMIFGVATLIALLSDIMTLEPGDIIATGTPSGIGAARNPPRFLTDGDVVEIDIERIGILRNRVVGPAGSGR
jgi:2-keto-4-pentenoate hydratase/2-oxohepta-3-ene-1,7-dioic acid hydratase in catechol pathway